MIASGDTIAAVATAPGDGGVAVIRISGEDALSILNAAFRRRRGGAWQPMRLYYGHVLDADGSVLDEAMAVYMRAPKTYTREDVAEIHCHGGHVVTGRVLRRVLALGARPAGPGEFTRRAFLNGRIDLTEAEAVMQLIASGSETAARASVRQLEGGVSGFVRRARERLIDLQAAIAAATDFPEEVDEAEAARDVRARLIGIRDDVAARCDERGARMVRDGVSVVLCGRPNAGKSSLLNALLAQEAAIVTDVPGTTRDVLTCQMRLDGLRLDLTDTAGQRDTCDAVEKIGVERARAAEQRADVALLVLDASGDCTAADAAWLNRADSRYILLLNKWDAADAAHRANWRSRCERALPVSARTGEGLDALLSALKTACRAAEPVEGAMTELRHIRAAGACVAALERAVDALDAGFPLDTAASDIREALDALGEITGENLSESVIDEIFRNFCVGK